MDMNMEQEMETGYHIGFFRDCVLYTYVFTIILTSSI